MRFINGISEIVDKHDFFIIDLWGVLHDGHDPYPGAINALKNIKAKGKKIILLSNAPRRSSKAKAILEKMGFSSNLYDMILTSGDVTFEYVKEVYAKGTKYYYIGPDKDRDLLEGLGMVEIAKPHGAEFAIATGFEGFGSVFSEKKHQLDLALKESITLLVANPDKKVVKQTGEEQICSGLMGEYYTQHGGRTLYFGKPHSNAYKKCLEFFGVNENSKLDCKRILCIGDSLHTDIVGANKIHAGSVFVAGGIYKNELYENGRINENNLRRLIETDKEKPEYFTNQFHW